MKRPLLNRRRQPDHCFTSLLALALVLGAGLAALACNVPVFRYALERWRSDPYRVTVFHRGPISKADRETLAPLFDLQDRGVANIAVRTVDVMELADETDQALWAVQNEPELPWLVVQYPAHLAIEALAWTGPLSPESTARLTDSPARQELVRRLAAGQTAVWLVLESGHAEKDDAAVKLLEEELKRLEQDLALPELTAAPDDELLAAIPLQVAFSVLRVPRSEAEESLVATLLHSEPDLAERLDPMVFPVFGRGRALLPLIGAGITPQNIYDSAAFLVGPCSCQVKEQNPGFDLLLTAEWDVLLASDGVPLETPVAPPLPDEPELVPIPSGAPPAATAVEVKSAPPSVSAPMPAFAKTWMFAGAAAVSVLVIVALVAAVMRAG